MKLGYIATRAKGHATTAAKAVHRHALSTRKKIIISGSSLLVVGVIVAQFLYPTDKVVLFAQVDGVVVGGEAKAEAVRKLDALYAKATVPVYYNEEPSVRASPTLKDIGLTVTNEARVAALDYPWYWRLVPSSALWYQAILSVDDVSITRSGDELTAYMAKTFGSECKIAPKDASIVVEGDALKVVPATSGGTCDYAELYGALEKVAAVPAPEKITVSGTVIAPAVDDTKAKAVLDSVVARVGEGVAIQVEGKQERIPRAKVHEWLEFTVVDGVLVSSVNGEKASAWLAETFGARLAVKPGVTTVTTRDFVEISRVSGPNGRALDTSATIAQLTQFVRGENDSVIAVGRVVPATMAYTRSYSATDAGLNALMEHFAQSHPGTYGISLIELSGSRRHANYKGDTQFTTASTYKLFVAYSALLRVESGAWNWSDQIAGGRNLTQCFDDMIVKSDNPCAEAMLKKIGFQAITNEARAIGATKTSFLGSDGVKSTAQDEALLLSLLHSGQILAQQSSRDVWTNALKRNVYRKGVPAGVPGISVANKVGFLDALLHDAAIVYSPSGTYVLVVLTNGSSWANIATLASQLEALRNGT